MSDTDKELRQLIKDEFDRSLAGWTFTPAMRQAVLDRIAGEGEPEATPVPTLSRRFRPAYWVAAAAAAFVLAINLWPRVSTDGRLTGTASDARSGGAPESAPGAEAAAYGLQATGELQALGAAPGQSGTADLAEADAASTLKAGGVRALSAISPVRLTLSVAEVPDVFVVERAGEKVSLHVSETTGRALTQDGAEEAQAGATAAAVPDALDLNPLPDGNVVVVQRWAVKIVDQHGNPVAESPVEPEAAAVAEGPAGETVVVSSDALTLFTATGKPAELIGLDQYPSLVAVSGKRMAVANDGGVEVYEGGARALTLPRLQPRAMALAPDGALAVLTGSPPDARLLIYAADGSLLLDRPVAPDGEGFGFIGDGLQVAVGSVVYDRTGDERWHFPFAPARVTALADGVSVLAWNSRQAVRVLADGGTQVWMAEVTDADLVRASGSARGDLVVLVAAADDGAAVWVIDQGGNQRHAERLSRVPVDVTASGDRILLLNAEGLEVRPLNR